MNNPFAGAVGFPPVQAVGISHPVEHVFRAVLLPQQLFRVTVSRRHPAVHADGDYFSGFLPGSDHFYAIRFGFRQRLFHINMLAGL